MKNLENVAGLQELSLQEMKDVNGGGEWKWQEALYCFLIFGLPGVEFYTLGTMQ